MRLRYKKKKTRTSKAQVEDELIFICPMTYGEENLSDNSLSLLNDTSPPKFDIRITSSPVYLARKFEHIKQYRTKPHEADAIQTTIGYIYFGDMEKATELYQGIKDRMDRQESIAHHDSTKLMQLYKLIHKATLFVIKKNLLQSMGSQSPQHTLALEIMKYFWIRVQMQYVVSINRMDARGQYDKTNWEKCEIDVNSKIKMQESLSDNDRVACICILQNISETTRLLKMVRADITSLNDVSQESVLIFDRGIDELSKCCEALSTLSDKLLYSTFIHALNHEKQLIESKKNQLIAEDKFQSSLRELEKRKNNLNRIIKTVKLDKPICSDKPTKPVQTKPRKKSTSQPKVEVQTEVVEPRQLLSHAYQLLQSAKFTEALALYKQALQISKKNGDILDEVQSLSSMAECYEVWFKYQPELSDNKEQAITIYEQMIRYGDTFRDSEVYDSLSPYLAFANLALDKLLEKNISSEKEIKVITNTKYDDGAVVKEDMAGKPAATQLSPQAYDIQPCYKIKIKLPIDEKILALMRDIPDSYIVGGAVRNLLLQHQPREYDIVTALTPDELVSQLTQKNYTCKIVGNIYPIVLVTLTTGEVIEVATFRDQKPRESTDTFKYHPDNPTVILNKNYARHPYPDTFNRDVTINCIYYDPRMEEVFSYIAETELDLKSKIIRIIGDPVERFSQDPIIILRVLELSYRLGFQLDENILPAIEQCKAHLLFVSPGRLLHQCHKVFYNGHSQQLFNDLIKFGLVDIMFPDLTLYLSHETLSYYPVLKNLFLEATVLFYQTEPISYPLLFATLLWPIVFDRLCRGEIFTKIANDVLQQQSQIIKILPFMYISIKNIWLNYLTNKNYFSTQLPSEAPFSSSQQTCLLNRFTHYVDHYTIAVNMKKLELNTGISHLNEQGEPSGLSSLSLLNDKNSHAFRKKGDGEISRERALRPDTTLFL